MKNKLNQATSFAINFSITELWFLMNQFEPAYVIGMDNPYPGWLVEDIEAEFQQAVRLLLRRGLARRADEDGILLDEVIANMVKTCVHPRHTLVVTNQMAAGNPTQRFVHFAPDWIVEHLNPDGETEHLLTVFRDRQALVDYLSGDLRLASPTSNPGNGFYLERDTLFEVSKNINEGNTEKGLAALEAAGLDRGISDQLSNTLADPVANASFTVLVNQNEPARQHTRGFGLLEGHDDFWLLHPYQKNNHEFIEFLPANGKVILKKFLEIIPI